jgi:hypothetical protein
VGSAATRRHPAVGPTYPGIAHTNPGCLFAYSGAIAIGRARDSTTRDPGLTWGTYADADACVTRLALRTAEDFSTPGPTEARCTRTRAVYTHTSGPVAVKGALFGGTARASKPGCADADTVFATGVEVTRSWCIADALITKGSPVARLAFTRPCGVKVAMTTAYRNGGRPWRQEYPLVSKLRKQLWHGQFLYTDGHVNHDSGGR